jgi:hypothetical protein
MRRTRSLVLVTTIAVAVSPLLASVPAGADQAPSPGFRVARSVEMFLPMDGGRQRTGDRVRAFGNSGRSNLRAVVVSRRGGEATRARSVHRGWAVRTPAASSTGVPPRAAIIVTNRGRRDHLGPRSRAFRFGADYRLNGTSEGVRDDGDNLIQRGAFANRGQYKIELDNSRPRCRVKGNAGEAHAIASRPLPRQQWYRAVCSRSGDTITLKVWRLGPHRNTLVVNSTNSDAIGAVRFARRWPLSIGGRVQLRGVIPAGHNDAFNGVIDRAFFDRS